LEGVTLSEPGREGESPVARKAGVFLAWLPLIGCVAAGLIGLTGAMLGMEKSDGRFNGGGIYLVGAAIAFGMLSNAMLRR
jgi:hypothetical protein